MIQFREYAPFGGSRWRPLLVGLPGMLSLLLQADVPVHHPQYGLANTNYVDLAYVVDEERYLSLAEIRSTITLTPPVFVASNGVVRVGIEYGDWPNVFDLTAMASGDPGYFADFLDAALRHEPDAITIRQEIVNATSTGGRVFFARDFISNLSLAGQSYSEVPYALVIWLDERRAREVKANPVPELGALRDQHVNLLNELLQRNVTGPGSEWHLCLRGNSRPFLYAAIVVRQTGVGAFDIPRMAPGCGESPSTSLALPPIPPWTPRTNPPPPIEKIPPPRQPPSEPPGPPPVTTPEPAWTPGPHPRPGRLLPGPDDRVVNRQSPRAGADDSAPASSNPCLDRLARQPLASPDELETLVQQTDVSVDNTYQEINRLIAEEAEALAVWNHQFAGRPVNGPTIPGEPELARSKLPLSDGSTASLDSCVSAKLEEIAQRIGGTVADLDRQDLRGEPYLVPELIVELPCGNCETGPYDLAEYERLRDALEAEINAALADLESMRNHADDLDGSYPQLRLLHFRGTIWDNVFARGTTLPAPLPLSGGINATEAFDFDAFVQKVRDVLRTGEASMDEAVRIAVALSGLETVVGRGNGPSAEAALRQGVAEFEEQVRQTISEAGYLVRAAAGQVMGMFASYGTQLKNAWEQDLAQMQWADGPLTPNEIRLLLDGDDLTPEERVALAEQNDLAAKIRYQQLLLVYLRNALAKLERQRADCLRRYREKCIDPKKCIGITRHQLAKAFQEFVKSTAGNTEERWTWSYGFHGAGCDCETYEAILAEAASYPPSFIEFIRCLKERDCPPPDQASWVEAGAFPGGHVELDPPSPSGSYPVGTPISMLAVPDAGFAFLGWEGDLEGAANPGTLLVDGSKQFLAVLAVFAPLLPLEVSASAGGAVTTPDLSEPGLPGTVIPLLANPEKGHYFAGWTGGPAASVNDNPLLLLLSAPRQVEAQFAPIFRPHPGIRLSGDWSFSGGFRIRIDGAPVLVFEVEVSTDLLTWTSLGLAVAGEDGIAEYRDLESGLARRFYRVKPADIVFEP